MHLRLTIVAGVVAVAAAAAAMRGRLPAPKTPLVIVTTAPSAARPSRELGVRSRNAGPRARIVVYVVGNVVRSGVFTLPGTARAVDALHAAGGVTPGTDMIAVNLAKPLVDGEELVFPAKGTVLPSAAGARRRIASPPAQRSKRSAKRRRKRVPADASGGPSGDTPGEVVDVNVADESTLETLPGIGSALATRIALVRQESGPFASLDDLLDVSGMTQSKLDALAPYVTFH